MAGRTEQVDQLQCRWRRSATDATVSRVLSGKSRAAIRDDIALPCAVANSFTPVIHAQWRSAVRR